jgi:hypothetical protein
VALVVVVVVGMQVFVLFDPQQFTKQRIVYVL